MTNLGKSCQSKDWEAHKLSCKRQNYLLKVHLHSEEITKPPIYRTLSCPADSTFEEFHEALQIAFNWAGTHTFDFMVKDPVAQAERAAEEEGMTKEEEMLKIMQNMKLTGKPVNGVRNLLRILEDDPYGPGGPMVSGPGGPFVPSKGIDFMHNSHRTHPETTERKASAIKLYEVLDKPRYKDMPLEYEYDFGDRWEHAITLLGRKDATDFFMCTDGESHYVAEDVGNCLAWNELKEAYKSDRPNKEQRDKMEWFERQASNRDPQGLKNGRESTWAKGMINRRLAELAGKAFSFT